MALNKRGIINLRATPPKFRVSKAGFSADSTDIADFLYREDFLYGQVLAAGTITNPNFPSNTYQTTISFSFNVGTVHVEVLYTSPNIAGALCFPAYAAYGGGATIPVFDVEWELDNKDIIFYMSALSQTVKYVVFKT